MVRIQSLLLEASELGEKSEISHVQCEKLKRPTTLVIMNILNISCDTSISADLSTKLEVYNKKKRSAG
jgi:hypothetical protein